MSDDSVVVGTLGDVAPVMDGGASAAAFLLGGIGTGNVSLGARGELRDWELANRPGKGVRNPFSFFAVRYAPVDGGAAPVARVLEARHRPPHESPPHRGDHGYYAGDVAGLPRFADARMTGRYPIVNLDLIDDTLPIEVRLTAFTPFVPLNADDSGIPCAVLRYQVRNRGPAALDVTIAGSLGNPVGTLAGADDFHFPRFEGRPHNTERMANGLHGLVMGSDLPPEHLLSGEVTLTTPADGDVSMKPQWFYGVWQDGAQRFWDELRDTGRLTTEPVASLDPEPHPDWMTRLRVGSLAVARRIEPGQTADFEFRLTWYFPNRPRGWDGNIVRIDPNLDQVVRNRYAALYPDAWAVAVDLDQRLEHLEATTRTFVGALYDSTLPSPVVESAGANLTVMRSTTCFRLEDGTFAAWEGSFNRKGSCEGTCTHVWNYAQSVAWLFPELERSARRIEWMLETDERGHMAFRTNQIFGSPRWEFHAAADGQLGTVVRTYREWLLGADDGFLREVWPAVVRVLDHAAREWDTDGDHVLDAKQHNTYDIEFVGVSPLTAVMYLAALRAAAELADHLGEVQQARTYLNAAALGAQRLDELCFNGEYYQQHVDDVDVQRYQHGTGVLSDQLLGQLLAHVVGLGHLLPAEHVRSAIGAVHGHNFRRDLTEHESVQRTYALGDEAGLVLCSWPRGGRPKIPFVYSDEVWTGIEHQVAAHLVYEGMIDEGLEIVRAVRARHDGVRRSPWNEAECGNHYARSLASWAVLLAFTGQRTNAHTATVDLAPALPGPQRAFFSTGTAWGWFELEGTDLTFHVEGGRLHAEHVRVHGTSLASAATHSTAGPGETLTFARP